MLVPAIICEQELRIRFLERILQPDTRYYYFQPYFDYELTVDRNDWKRIQFVSISRKNQLLAYLEARINREFQIVEDLLLLSLGSGGLTLEAICDTFRFLAYLLDDRGFRKIFFRYIKDNPAGRQYERLLGTIACCGSIQGVLRDYVTLADAKSYDLVIMDIQKKPYLDWYGRRHEVYSPA